MRTPRFETPRFAAVLAVLAGLSLLAPAASQAASRPAVAPGRVPPGTVPPGNSGANQYVETLPGVGGNKPTGSGSGASPAKTLGASEAARLEALGPEGRAAAGLAAATAPHAVGRGGSAAKAPPAPSGSSGPGQVLRHLTGTSGSGGMGLLLPLVIALALVGSLAFAVARRRAARGLG